jgi:hypothetical protein
MGSHFKSEQELFSDSESEGKLRRLSLQPGTSTTPKEHRRVSSLKTQLPINIMSAASARARGPSDSSSSGEDQGAAGTVQETITSPKPKQSGTVLGIGSSVRGKPSLIRSINGKEIDFWNQVVSMKMKALESALSVAAVDSTYDMKDFIEGIMYQGFDRELYISTALEKISVKHFCQFAIIGAVRGSDFQKIIEKSLNVPADLVSAHSSAGFIRKPKKKTDLTILRCTASIPHWVSYWLLKAGVGKKIPNKDCHSIFQFPAAAAIPMSRQNRLEHLEFCDAFSSLLPGGSFNVNIYTTMFANMISVDSVPAEVLSIAGVSSMSEANQIGASEMLDKYGSKALTRR